MEQGRGIPNKGTASAGFLRLERQFTGQGRGWCGVKSWSQTGAEAREHSQARWSAGSESSPLGLCQLVTLSFTEEWIGT